MNRDEALAKIAAALESAEVAETQALDASIAINDVPPTGFALEQRLRDTWREIQAAGLKLPLHELEQRFPRFVSLFRFVLHDASAPPLLLGTYRFVERVGGGSFGLVYKYWDDQLQRHVAIKMPRRDKEKKDAEFNLNEARSLARLDHPGIVPVYFMGQTPSGDIYVVSRFIEGGDLEQALKRQRYGIREAARLVTQVAYALDYAHQHGFVHRDIKPSNIMLGPDHEPILVDFGFALRTADFGTGPQFIGTPKYFSPEQARYEGHLVDGRSDIYSLGVVFYELLTGRVPFDVHNVPELLDRIQTVEVQPPRQIDPSIPRELERICLKALAKRVSERYLTAGDLASDLHAWEVGDRRPQSGSSADTRGAPKDQIELVDAAVLPKGLRSYDEADANFFLKLVPGPRDRDGLPDSIRFWKTRIESADPATAFRVGVLLGPTGSGKSSLIRAGLIPRLDSQRVHVIFEESHPHDFEGRLLRRLRRLRPMHDATTSLRQSLAFIREGGGLPPERKLLIVLDQFEQWLSEHGGEQSNDLLEGLRQCDGTRVQVLLLVRDDFTLATTTFMQQLDEALHQNSNFAVQPPFGESHARQVLLHFGRAFGQLPEGTLEPEHTQFIADAVTGLAEDGQLVPIHLAIFSEMVKDKPWRPTTLHRSGGIRGVGIAFLQEVLGGSRLRPHAPLVRRILEALLPEAGQVIKGSPVARSQLLVQAAPGSPRELDQVLDLLDGELKLVAKAGSSTGSSVGSSSRDSEPSYQLTHDFLVPIVREWLAIDERGTRRGRARRRLQELSQAYKVSHDSRHLPRLREWLAIRLLTSPESWSDHQRTLMRRADRRWVTVGAAALIVLLVLAFGGRELRRQSAAQTLFTELTLASPQQMPATLRKAQGFQRYLEPRLRRAVPGYELTSNPGDQRKRWNSALALASFGDENELLWLLDRLTSFAPGDLNMISQVLMPRRRAISQHLGPRIAGSLQGSDASLHLAALLAQADPQHASWDTWSEPLARLLVAAQVTEISDWGLLFEPLQSRLTPKLLPWWKNVREIPDGQRPNLWVLLTRYAGDDSEQWTSIAQYARPEELKVVLSRMADRSDSVRSAMERRFAALKKRGAETVDTSSSSPATSLVEKLKPFAGLINGESALVQRIPQDAFQSLDDALQESGYRLDSVRPYQAADQSLVAATWRRDPIPSRLEWDLSVSEAESRHKELAAAGWRAQDFSRRAITSDTTSDPKFTVLWVKPEEPVESRLYLAKSRDDFQKLRETWEKDKFSYDRYEAWPDDSGSRSYSVIVTRDEAAAEIVSNIVEYSLADFADPSLERGIRFPDLVLTDCRFAFLPNSQDVFPLEQRIEHHTQTLKTARSNKEKAAAILTLVDTLLKAGRNVEAAARIAEVPADFQENPTTIKLQATLDARQGNLENLQKAIERYAALSNRAHVLTWLKLRAAILQADATAVKSGLEALERLVRSGEKSATKVEDLEILARASAATAVFMAEREPDFARQCRQQAIAQLRQVYLDGPGVEPEIYLQDVEYAGLRSEPEFRVLLQALRTDQVYSASYQHLPRQRTHLLASLSEDDHQRLTIDRWRSGKRPLSITCQSSPADGRVRVSSVWLERLPTIEESVRHDQNLANLALALASLGASQSLREVLSDELGSSCRAEAIEAAPKIISPAILIAMFRQTDSEATALQRSILLGLGGFSRPEQADDGNSLRGTLERLARTHSDPGLRSAAEWCYRRWGYPELPRATGPQPAPTSKKWIHDPLGRRMIRVTFHDPFLMGAVPGEPGKGESETRHWARVDYDYLLGECEVTVEDFQKFLADPEIEKFYGDKSPSFTARFAPTPDCPIISVPIEDAARFCQWLSQKDHLPESEWCYPGIFNNSDQPFSLPKNYFQRSGYRLPLEIEWELACRAGAETARPFGDSEGPLPSYGWYVVNSQGRVHPVGSLRPNDWGFFDMLGNAREWCFDRHLAYRLPFDGIVRTTLATDVPATFREPFFPVRGGSLTSDAGEMRAAARKLLPPQQHAISLGFRYARTVKP